MPDWRTCLEHRRVVSMRDVFVFCGILCTLSALESKKLETCRDVAADTASRELKIERLKIQLQEYRITDRNKVEEVQDGCNTFDTCSSCLRNGNSLNCGWCFLYSRCTFQENCPGTQSNISAWIQSNLNTPGRQACPRIQNVSPQHIPLVRPTWLHIYIPNLPLYEGDLICSFQVLGKFVVSKAVRTDDGVKCWSYLSVELPENKKSEPVAVSVRTPGGPDFVSTVNFTIFNCQNYKSCTECTSSPFPCSWCLDGNRCTHDINQDCKNDVIVDGATISQPRIRKGHEYCPKIIPIAEEDDDSKDPAEILVPAMTKKRIHVKTEHLTGSIVNSRFYCSVPGHTRVEAQILGDIVYCMPIQFKTVDRSPVSNLPLNVLWSAGSIKLDNPYTIHVLVFDCSLMATSCGTCLEIPERYSCGWCEETNSCTIRDRCSTEWLDKNQRCIKPEILGISPKAAVINKPTNVTIDGINFGKKPSDIHVRLVSESGNTISECEPYHELYITSTKISCLLDAPDSSSEGNETTSGFFEVLLWNQYIAVSNEDFSFVEPSISSINPVKGTKSGGNLLEIHGRHLNAGNNVEVYIADIPCKIISREATTIRCKTSPSKRTFSSAVRVVFDGVEKASPVYYFYVEDPWVRHVRSEFQRDNPRGTPSGGSLIIVEGDYFDHVSDHPYFYILIDGEEYIGTCIVDSPTQMRCASPRVPTEKVNFCGNEGFLTFDYGFKMDDVLDVQNISSLSGFNRFQMFPDPYFLPFKDEGKVKVYGADYLVIHGFNIDSVHDEEAVTVEIGSGKCVITAMSHSQLICRPPTTQPPAKVDDVNKLPEVVVKVSDTMEFFIGFLRYVT